MTVEFLSYISVVKDNRLIGCDDVQCGVYICNDQCLEEHSATKLSVQVKGVFDVCVTVHD